LKNRTKCVPYNFCRDNGTQSGNTWRMVTLITYWQYSSSFIIPSDYLEIFHHWHSARTQQAFRKPSSSYRQISLLPALSEIFEKNNPQAHYHYCPIKKQYSKHPVWLPLKLCHYTLTTPGRWHPLLCTRNKKSTVLESFWMLRKHLTLYGMTGFFSDSIEYFQPLYTLYLYLILKTTPLMSVITCNTQINIVFLLYLLYIAPFLYTIYTLHFLSSDIVGHIMLMIPSYYQHLPAIAFLQLQTHLNLAMVHQLRDKN